MIAMTPAGDRRGGRRHRRQRRRRARSPGRRSWTAGSPSAAACSSPSSGERVDGHDFADAAVDAGRGRGAVLARHRPPRRRRRRRRSPRSRGSPSTSLGAGCADGSGSWRSPGRRARPAPRTCSPRCSPAAGPTVATFGSFNNELGLPLTVLRADTATRYLVLEMGARHVGDLRGLVRGRAAGRVAGAQRRQGAPRRVRLPGGDRAGQGRARRGARRATASRCSTPTTRWSRRWRDRTDAPGSSPSAPTPAADVRFADVDGRRPRPPDLRRCSYGGRRGARVALGLVGEHHAGNAAAAAAVALVAGRAARRGRRRAGRAPPPRRAAGWRCTSAPTA